MIEWLRNWVYSFWGVVVGSMLAGEYFKPGRIISNFLDDVRGRI
jgi:hypothetical protein